MKFLAFLRVSTLVFCALLFIGCTTTDKKPVADNTAIDPIEKPEGETSVKTEPSIADSEEATGQINDKPAELVDRSVKRIDSGEVLFDTLRNNFSSPVCIDGKHNQQWRKRYAGYPQAFANHLDEILPLFGYVTEQVIARDLPAEFALIPIIESWYRPEARGPGGPAGMWQIMSNTAIHLGLRVDKGYDGRLSPVDATNAALDYLAHMHKNFGDWRTTAMGYNAGEFRIRKALQKDGSTKASGEDRIPAGLSEITYAYIAKMRALACLIAQPRRQNLQLPQRRFTPLEVVDITGSGRTLTSIAGKYSLSVNDLRKLNPAYRDGRITANTPGKLLVPISGDYSSTELASRQTSDAETAVDDVEQNHENDSSNTIEQSYVVKRGDSLWLIARKHKTTVNILRRLNQLSANARLRPGQRLRLLTQAINQAEELVVANPSEDKSEYHNQETAKQSSDATITNSPSMRTHRVNNGDSLWTIARRYRIKLAELMQANDINKNAVLRPGQILQLPE